MKKKFLTIISVLVMSILFLISCASNGGSSTESENSKPIESTTNNTPTQTTTEVNDDFRYDIYLLATNSGYSGTYEEWLKLIAGDQIELTVTDNVLKWKYKAEDTNAWHVLFDLSTLKGADGKSAYEIAVEAGFTGTEAEWVDSLKGNDGTNGTNGKDGVSVAKIEKTGTDGLVDTYTITFSNGTTTTFTITNGSKGEKGQDAIQYIPCIFNNYDGTKLYEFYYEKGSDIVYDGPTPIKDGEDFVGWDKSLENIQVPTIFTAKFMVNVRFENYDGTLLYQTRIESGNDVEYKGDTPTKPQDVNGTNITDYTFSNWDKSLYNISASTTITANYSSRTFTGYKVTFLDSDNTELYNYYCEVNTDARYPYDLPWHYDQNNVHIFSGWNQSIKNITEAITVKASYITLTREQNGEYPQSKVTDNTSITALNGLSSTNARGYYEYNNNQYAKYDNDYYLVEPIKWRFLDSGEGKVFVVSDLILDQHRYDGSSNNYENSEIRNWLNNDFLNKAFADQSVIATTSVDNSVASTGLDSNTYVCETTYDKLFLLSRQEAQNANYEFENDADRSAKVTDYAKARGVITSSDDYVNNGYWWLRSPRSANSYSAYFVYSDGYITGMVDGLSENYGVRPACWIIL